MRPYAQVGLEALDFRAEVEARFGSVAEAARAVVGVVDEHGSRRDRLVPTTAWSVRRFRDAVCDAEAFRSYLPAMLELYERGRELAEEVSGRPVILSPYGRSAVTGKVYRRGDEHGWHIDTNGVSGVLYLTDNAGGDLEHTEPLPAPAGSDWLVEELVAAAPRHRFSPRAGALAILRGLDVWHRVAPLEDDLRVAVIFNYYHPDAVSRPAGLDAVHYG